jgi:hypothetical protein
MIKKRRFFLLLIPLMLILVTIVIWIVIESRQPPLWQADLDAYLNSLKAASAGDVTVIRVVEAHNPWNFTEAMSQQIFDESVYFPPYPYPPEDVWCALLDVEGKQMVVYIALHQDLYNADTILHESGKLYPDPQLSLDLEKIDCEL